jgi:hypothetical protein
MVGLLYLCRVQSLANSGARGPSGVLIEFLSTSVPKTSPSPTHSQSDASGLDIAQLGSSSISSGMMTTESMLRISAYFGLGR